MMGSASTFNPSRVEAPRRAFDQTLSAAWPAFVDCQKRMATLGPFLLEAVGIGRGDTILDAAAGIGCETRYLAKAGCDVVANEISAEFRGLFLSGLRSENIVVTGHDWRDFGHKFLPSSFDAIILLGNSLALMLDDIDRIDVLRILYGLLKPGSPLVVDQRDFEYLLKRFHELSAGKVLFSTRVMYCGDQVRAVPTRTSGASLTMEYRCVSNDRFLGSLEMAIMGSDWLRSALETTGYEVESYSDLSVVQSDEREFVTYVARKPRGSA